MRSASKRRCRGGASCALVLLASTALLLPSCNWDGQFTVLGYTTRPNYDCAIHTVHVPMFKNLTLRRGIEFDVTRAVVREIEAKTPYKVVSDRYRADTELTGTILVLNKNIINRNQLNEVREAETTLAVNVVWRDLRAGHEGEVLSHPAHGSMQPAFPSLPAPIDASHPPPVPLPADTPPPPGAPMPGVLVPAEPPPVPVQSVATFIPELGESLTTAEKKNVDRLAVQIVSMMETPW
ncbi:MAG TPA: LptE family protein [Gemmataceae bacterium]|nr:LptE family protein [Gemmataceae bacterium]